MSIIEKMNKTFNDLSQKTSDAANAAKLKMDISSLKSDLKVLYRELGELTYNMLKAEEEFDHRIYEICEKIDHAKKEIETKEHEMMTDTLEKPTKICVECGAQLGDEDKFCSKCGGRAILKTSHKVEGIVCPNCAYKNKLEAVKCINCGAELEGNYMSEEEKEQVEDL